jgi:tRNA modification GTPase
MHDADTIAAISSPHGEGGIGIIRMTGPAAHSIVSGIFKPKKAGGARASHHLRLGYIFDPETLTDIDEAYVVLMDSPATYTKENMAEIFAHGGFASMKEILSLVLKQGARLAKPGEFTKRAFLNGRIDLAQAESVLDIIHSESAAELQSALMHSKGILSDTIREIKDGIHNLFVETEAHIDFPEEGLEFTESTRIPSILSLRNSVQDLLDSHIEGRAVAQGLEILIVGKPNVGKSSLLNALLMKEKAIVTALPGTTRDFVEDVIHVKGIKFRIIDSAGLRSPRDEVEKEGIERVRRRIPDADIIVWVVDGADDYSLEDEAIHEIIKEQRAAIIVNKTDLPRRIDHAILVAKKFPIVEVSARTQAGLDRLREWLYDQFSLRGNNSDRILITNIRHKNALEKTAQNLTRAEECMTTSSPAEFIAFELREALAHLGEITGEVYSDDLLSEIFSRFCIGK